MRIIKQLSILAGLAPVLMGGMLLLTGCNPRSTRPPATNSIRHPDKKIGAVLPAKNAPYSSRRPVGTAESKPVEATAISAATVTTLAAACNLASLCMRQPFSAVLKIMGREPDMINNWTEGIVEWRYEIKPGSAKSGSTAAYLSGISIYLEFKPVKKDLLCYRAEVFENVDTRSSTVAECLQAAGLGRVLGTKPEIDAWRGEYDKSQVASYNISYQDPARQYTDVKVKIFPKDNYVKRTLNVKTGNYEFTDTFTAKDIPASSPQEVFMMIKLD
jgi:hypothetical protein